MDIGNRDFQGSHAPDYLTLIFDSSYSIRHADSFLQMILGIGQCGSAGRDLGAVFAEEGLKKLKSWWESSDEQGDFPELCFRDAAVGELIERAVWTAKKLITGDGPPQFGVLTAKLESRNASQGERARLLPFISEAIEETDLAVWVNDIHGRLLLFNRGAERISGYASDEVVGKKSLYDLFAEQQEVDEVLSVLKSEGVIEKKPMMVDCANGSLRPVRVSERLVRDHEGGVVGAVGIAVDRTDELSMAAELESLYRQLAGFSSITADVISQDNTDRLFQQIAQAITEISDFSRALISIFVDEPPFRRIIGYSGIKEEEFQKLKKIPMDRKRFKDFMREEFKLSSNCFYIPGSRKEVFRRDEVVYGSKGSFEEGYWRPDDNLMVTLKSGGQLLGYISVDDSKSGRRPTAETVRPLELFASQVTQVLQRNRLEEELVRRHRDLQLLYDISVIVNSSLDADEVLQKLVEIIHERMRYFQVAVYLLDGGNMVQKALYGKAPHESTEVLAYGAGIIGAAAIEGKVVISNDVLNDPRYLEGVPETRSEIAVPIKSTAIIEGEETEGIIGVLNVESEVPYSFSEEDGRRLELIANTASVAIENSRLMNRVLSLLKEEASYSQELEQKKAELDEFVHTISHDLRSPLNSINGYAEMLQIELGEEAKGEINRYIGRIRANVESVTKMINALLELSRVGRVVEHSQSVSVKQLLDEIRVDMIASGEGEEVEFDYLDIPEKVTAERRLFTQLFTNLMQNAYKYRHQDRPPKITIGCIDEGNFYRFFVADNGIGIDQKHLKSIFVFGVRLREKNVDGTGAGLAIAKKIVETLGGRIWVESVKDEGSTFYFTLPK
jgi:PAS domain S-box-containing protein